MIQISKFSWGGIVFILILASVYSINLAENPTQKVSPTATPTLADPIPLTIAALEDINNIPFQDNQALYENDDPYSIVAIYVTVRKGSSIENTHYTWEQVNQFDKWVRGSFSANDEVGQAEVIVQFGNEEGPVPGELGYGAIEPNGTIQIRGASSSENPNPKSYKIELFDNAGTWRGQSTIPINKHYYDPIRIRNKLTYDLLKGIPAMVTLRTQFVHLFIKDETIEPVSQHYVDYGLYTQVEQVNRAFLKNHHLDPNGQLYKATSFEFFRYKDQIRLERDPLFDEAEFSYRLEIKGNRDHSKLIQMLEDVNNYSIPISDSFEKYFDLDNYFTWMAYNILVGNVDTQNQNFYLYSPLNSEKWYFIPWDFDGDLARQEQKETGAIPYLNWEVGMANYWGVVLHNRVLRIENYRNMLDAKIIELSRYYLSPYKIDSMLKNYRAVVEPFLNRLPDSKYLRINQAQMDLSYSLIPSEIEVNKQLYFETQKSPMPFFLGVPEISGDSLIFNWDESYSLLPQTITYRIFISKDIKFSNVIFQADLLNTLQIETPIFEPGAYYWRVIAINEDGNYQYPFDAYLSIVDGYTVRNGGMRYFTITSDGKVGEIE